MNKIIPMRREKISTAFFLLIEFTTPDFLKNFTSLYTIRTVLFSSRIEKRMISLVRYICVLVHVVLFSRVGGKVGFLSMFKQKKKKDSRIETI